MSRMIPEALRHAGKILSEFANMFKFISLLSRKKFLSQTLVGKFEELPISKLMEGHRVAEAQNRRVEWCDEECFAESGIPVDYPNFWQGVAKYNKHKDLATYAFTSHIAPVNSAIAEMTFLSSLLSKPCLVA